MCVQTVEERTELTLPVIDNTDFEIRNTARPKKKR